MNAFELYEAVFDSAREEFVPETREDRIKDVVDYADGAFDLYVDSDVAGKIVDAEMSFQKSEQGSNNFYHLVQQPLESIEL